MTTTRKPSLEDAVRVLPKDELVSIIRSSSDEAVVGAAVEALLALLAEPAAEG